MMLLINIIRFSIFLKFQFYNLLKKFLKRGIELSRIYLHMNLIYEII